MTIFYMAKFTNGVIDAVSIWENLETAYSYDSSLVQVSMMAGAGMTLDNIPPLASLYSPDSYNDTKEEEELEELFP